MLFGIDNLTCPNIGQMSRADLVLEAQKFLGVTLIPNNDDFELTNELKVWETKHDLALDIRVKGYLYPAIIYGDPDRQVYVYTDRKGRITKIE